MISAFDLGKIQKSVNVASRSFYLLMTSSRWSCSRLLGFAPHLPPDNTRGEGAGMALSSLTTNTMQLPPQNDIRSTKCVRQGHAEHCVGNTALVLAASLKDNVHPHAGRL